MYFINIIKYICKVFLSSPSETAAIKCRADMSLHGASLAWSYRVSEKISFYFQTSWSTSWSWSWSLPSSPHCHPHHIWPGRAAEWGGRWKIWDSWLSGLFGMQCTKLNIRYYENMSSCKILCHFTILTTPKISYGINEISFALCHKLLVKCLKSWWAINATKHLNPDVGSWGLMYISRWELWKRVNLWSSKLTRRTLEHIRLWIYTSTQLYINALLWNVWW